MAVFVNGGANAIAAASQTIAGTDHVINFSMEFEYQTSGTGVHTFTVRMGTNSSTFHINGYSSATFYGGVLKSTFVLEEIQA
jgi:hypothetical protein